MPLAAQSALVAVEEENFRASPRGTILAQLVEGTPLVIGARQGQWREATLEAWIWGPSVEPDTRGGHDLSVSVTDGENLRATPNGRRLGRAREGMLLDRVEEQGRWVRVRRTAWIWGPSIRIATQAPPPPAPAEPSLSAPTREFTEAGPGAVVQTTPTGDTLARIEPGASVEVLARDGEWARIRVEGWTRVAALGGAGVQDQTVLQGVSRDTLQADPARFRSRLLEWTLQFISVQEAEEFRTDFLPGESFILTRGPGDDAGFVYLAVPPELLSDVQTLDPLQRIRVVGRVRSARSALTGAPVLDLLEITGR